MATATSTATVKFKWSIVTYSRTYYQSGIKPSTNASTFFRLALNSPKHHNYLSHITTSKRWSLTLASLYMVQINSSFAFRVILATAAIAHVQVAALPVPFNLLSIFKKASPPPVPVKPNGVAPQWVYSHPFQFYAAWLINLLSCFSLFQIKPFVKFILPAACCSTC